jgi:hypothetical protein
MMALTKSFSQLVQRRVANDAGFAITLLREGIDTILIGDFDTGKAIRRDYIKATVGYEKVGATKGRRRIRSRRNNKSGSGTGP